MWRVHYQHMHDNNDVWLSRQVDSALDHSCLFHSGWSHKAYTFMSGIGNDGVISIATCENPRVAQALIFGLCNSFAGKLKALQEIQPAF